MTDFRVGNLNPVCLLKGLLKDKGALDYSTVSITTLRNRIAELDDLEDVIINEMQVLEELFKEVVDLSDLVLRYQAKRKSPTKAYSAVGHSLKWRFRTEGNRVGDYAVITGEIADLISRLPIRYQEIIVDFDARKNYLNYLVDSTSREYEVCTRYLDDFMAVESALAMAGCAVSIE